MLSIAPSETHLRHGSVFSSALGLSFHVFFYRGFLVILTLRYHDSGLNSFFFPLGFIFSEICHKLSSERQSSKLLNTDKILSLFFISYLLKKNKHQYHIIHEILIKDRQEEIKEKVTCNK